MAIILTQIRTDTAIIAETLDSKKTLERKHADKSTINQSN